MKVNKTKYLILVAMLSAIAFTVMIFGRIPIVAWLKYDPKDVIIVLAGLIMGPLAAVIISVVVPVVEMFTFSDTGVIGMIMNIIASLSYAFIASLFYKKKRTISSAVIGLIVASIITIAVMLLWNYIITPLYMNVSREEVAGMLIPIFLPFNAIKVSMNSAITLLIYKPITQALRKAHLMPYSKFEPTTTSAPITNDNGQVVAVNSKKFKINIKVLVFSLVTLAICVICILALQGII